LQTIEDYTSGVTVVLATPASKREKNHPGQKSDKPCGLRVELLVQASQRFSKGFR